MEEDDPLSSLTHRAQLLQTLISPLSSSTSRLSNKSRTIPHDKDFHFYNNFPEFKIPVKEISSKAQSSLQSLSSSSNLFSSKTQPTLPSDLDDSYDWLVNLNDEFIERFNHSLDDFKNSREKEEVKAGNLQLEEGGFQLVRNRKKKESFMDEVGKDTGFQSSRGLKEKNAVGMKSKVQFHIPTIRRPQDEFNILVNNVNKPFEHVWLEKSEDGSRFVHPLEKLSISNFIDRSIQEDEIVRPLPLESTPFQLVEGVKELKQLAAKLRNSDEFAVDLEQSFQGLTCLMQISTRTEDFIVDTLKLRVHIGPYLREVFKDPAKRKVMHGADRDIDWLQRDFGIYVCNLFDTGQASRVMQLERNSLEYLLHHFCGVKANKEYQNADWRLRPLPDEMIKYAREDTHYLLHIYDLMRSRLLSASSDEDDLLFKVYKRSYEVCTHFYQKEILTDNSFLHIYGLQESDFNSKQLAVADGLYQWRDKVAREEDESTGYILPNKALLEIAKQTPESSGKLRRLVKAKHSFVERHLGAVISLIRSQIEKSSDYESIAEQLEKARLERSTLQKTDAANYPGTVSGSEDPMDSTTSQTDAIDVASNTRNSESSTNVAVDHANPKNFSSQITCQQEEKTQPMSLDIGCSSKEADKMAIIEETKIDNVNIDLPLPNKKASVASVQVKKMQTCSLGALLGNSASRRKLNPDNWFSSEQEKNVNKVEQIKSSVALPFHSFTARNNPSEPILPAISKETQPEISPQNTNNTPSVSSKLEDVIQLENNASDSEESLAESAAVDAPYRENSTGEAKVEEELTSLSDLSSSFQLCFQSISQSRSGSSKKSIKQSQEPEVCIEVKPFDYEAARKNFSFGRGGGERKGGGADDETKTSREKRRGSAAGQPNNGEERERGLRRQAFPPTGNRSTTYK